MLLQNKAIQIVVEPNLGGALKKFTFNGIDVLRPNTTDDSVPQSQSLFIMMPYCSHIENGHFNYYGINRCVPPNQKNYVHPIHGDFWLNACEIAQQSENKIELRYTHKKNQGFPFDYMATVTYSLKKNGLDITLSLYNPSELPMPCGMGIHPYFLHPKSAQIQFISSHIWHHQQDPIFDRPYPTPHEWDFAKTKALNESFDTAFGGWDGVANIIYPKEKLQINITAQDIFHHLILFAPEKADFFCLESVSHTPNAFNLAAYGVIGTGIQSIGAHQTLSKTITFTCQNI